VYGKCGFMLCITLLEHHLLTTLVTSSRTDSQCIRRSEIASILGLAHDSIIRFWSAFTSLGELD